MQAVVQQVNGSTAGEKTMSPPPIVLASACLTGLCTRYDGKAAEVPGFREQVKNSVLIPVCPEQLGGLPTPRTAADIIDGDGFDVLDGLARVICKDGTDVTDEFIRGARQVLEIARSQDISKIFLKARSPSCGIGRKGVTAALLERNGFRLEEYG